MADEEIVVTHETLFELFRREKSRDELQKLSATFFSDVASYIKSKKELLAEQENKQDLFAATQKDNLRKQLESASKLVKELFEKRERKIIDMALITSRTSSNIVDTSALLDEEKGFFNQMVGHFNGFRNDILFTTLSAKAPRPAPEIQIKPVVKSTMAYSDNQLDQFSAADELTPREIAAPDTSNQGLLNPDAPRIQEQNPRTEAPSIQISPVDLIAESLRQEQAAYEQAQNSSVLVRFLSAVPKFLGPNLETYGPFEEENMANLPSEIAKILISKEKVEEVKEDSAAIENQV